MNWLIVSCLYFASSILATSSTWSGNDTNNLWFPISIEPRVNWDPPTIPGAPGNADIIAIFPLPNPSILPVAVTNANGASLLLNTIQVNDTYSFNYFSGSITLGGGTVAPSINVAPGKTLFFESNEQLTVFSNVGTATLSGNLNLGGGLLAKSSLFTSCDSSITVSGNLSSNYAMEIAQNSSLPPTPSIIGGTLNSDSLYIHGANTFVFFNACANVTSPTTAIVDHATVQINGGTFTSSLFSANLSNVNITSGTLTIPGSTFTHSLLNITGGTVNFNNDNPTFNHSNLHVANGSNLLLFGATFQNNSTLTVDQNGLFIQLPTNFYNSALNISQGDLTGSNLILSSGSSVNIAQGDCLIAPFFIQDSSVNITQGNLIPANQVQVSLTSTYNHGTYFNIGTGNVTINNSFEFLADSSLIPGNQYTFTLFSVGGQILNKEKILYPSSSSLIWETTFTETESNESITITAYSSHPSPHQTLASLTSNQTLTTLQRNENMRENRMRGFATEQLLSQRDVSSNDYLASNRLIVQETLVEFLGERAIERPNYPWSFYIVPTGSFGNTKTQQGQCGCGYYTAGFFTGFDWATSYRSNPEQNYAFGLGTTGYYNHFHTDVANHGGKTDIDQIFVNIYGTWISRCLEELSLNFSVGAGYDWHHFNRVTGNFGTLAAQSDPGGYEIGSFFGLEYLFSSAQFPKMGHFRFIPIAMLEYNHLSLNDYTEHGAGVFNLRVQSEALNSLRTFLGLRMNYFIHAHCSLTIRPEITLGWQREYLNTSQRFIFSNFASLNPQTATLFTVAPNRNTFIGGTDLYLRIYDQHSLLFNYQLSWSNLLFANSFFLEWKVEF